MALLFVGCLVVVLLMSVCGAKDMKPVPHHEDIAPSVYNPQVREHCLPPNTKPVKITYVDDEG